MLSCIPASFEADESQLRLGIAGPVGSGKTALVEALCRTLAGSPACRCDQ